MYVSISVSVSVFVSVFVCVSLCLCEYLHMGRCRAQDLRECLQPFFVFLILNQMQTLQATESKVQSPI